MFLGILNSASSVRFRSIPQHSAALRGITWHSAAFRSAQQRSATLLQCVQAAIDCTAELTIRPPGHEPNPNKRPGGGSARPLVDMLVLVTVLSTALAPLHVRPAARHRPARCCLDVLRPFWFDPLSTFGLQQEQNEQQEQRQQSRRSNMIKASAVVGTSIII